MKIDADSLKKIDALKISREDKSFLSILARYLGKIPSDVLSRMSRETLQGDALQVAETLIEVYGRTLTDSSAMIPKSAGKAKTDGVEEFARVLKAWAEGGD